MGLNSNKYKVITELTKKVSKYLLIKKYFFVKPTLSLFNIRDAIAAAMIIIFSITLISLPLI